MEWLPDVEKILQICLFVSTEYRQTDGRTDTARRLCIASRGKHSRQNCSNNIMPKVFKAGSDYGKADHYATLPKAALRVTHVRPSVRLSICPSFLCQHENGTSHDVRTLRRCYPARSRDTLRSKGHRRHPNYLRRAEQDQDD